MIGAFAHAAAVLLSLCAEHAPPPVVPVAPPAAGPPRQQRAPEPIAPPFVTTTGAQPQPPRAAQGQCPPPYIKGARQWVVEPGTSWRLFADKVLPGDEILFTAWFHVPQEFVGLQGTAERPIFIRSRDEKPAAIACEEFGLAFKRCKHLVVENLVFFNSLDAAVLVDGAPVADASPDTPLGAAEPGGWNSDILVRNCTVAGSRGRPNQDAVRVSNTNAVNIDSVRVDGWQDAAVEVNGCRRVLVRGLMTAPERACAQRRGVAVLGPSSEISVTGCSFNASIDLGVQVGTLGAPNENGVPPVPPVERMRIDRCLFDRTGTGIVLANVRDLTISRVSLIDLRNALYAVPDDAGVVERVLIEYALASWQPGALQAFAPHPPRVRATSVTLGDNLWFSAELPAAFEALGQPFGFQASEQVHGVDPRLDPSTMRPQAADAVRYGVFSIAAPTGGAAPTPSAPGRPAPSKGPEAPTQPPQNRP